MEQSLVVYIAVILQGCFAHFTETEAMTTRGRTLRTANQKSERFNIVRTKAREVMTPNPPSNGPKKKRETLFENSKGHEDQELSKR